MTDEKEEPDLSVTSTFREFFALRRDVLILSVAMFAFSLSFQMTGRYVPRYIEALGAGAFVVGVFGSLRKLIGTIYPYPGGAFSDRVGSRKALTLFGLVSTFGFGFWILAPYFSEIPLFEAIPAWAWVFVGLFLVQAWKSLGLGATFAIVKQSVPPSKLATGFASTETFRRVGFLIAPMMATFFLVWTTDFVEGFEKILIVAVFFSLIATLLQHFLYEPTDTPGKEFSGLDQIAEDIRGLPSELRPLLVADIFIRFANGMAYDFFVLVVTVLRGVDATLFGVYLGPDAFFGVLLSIEMVVALLSMVPTAKIAEITGLKPVVTGGFFVYAVFPVLIILAPPNPLIFGVLFAFSGLRFAGLPAHKALIVGPAEKDEGGRVTGSYYVVRNAITIPSAALGGIVYGFSPEIAFGLATVVGLIGTVYFAAFGEEFESYA